MEPIRCFLLERAGFTWRWLRRTATGDCPLMAEAAAEYRYHQAMRRVGDGAAPQDGLYGEGTLDPAEFPADDPRWPSTCGCGYAFPYDADRQLFTQAVYRTAGGDLYHLHSEELPGGVTRAPVGAMWYAEWWPGRAPDGGPCLVVRIPRHPDGSGVSDWLVDGPSIKSPAPAWKRTGIPPAVTADPSIWTHQPDGWHGFLTKGLLTRADQPRPA